MYNMRISDSHVESCLQASANQVYTDERYGYYHGL